MNSYREWRKDSPAPATSPLCPSLYHRDGPDCQDDPRTRSQRLGDRRVINDVEATVKFLQSHRAVDGKRIGVIGFCMGGRVVYLLAATNPAFKAAVTFYPGNTGRAWGRDIPITLRTHRGYPLPDPRPLRRR